MRVRVCVSVGFVRKNDMVEHVARLAWDAALPFMRKPLLRVALVKPLAPICSVVNRLGISDRQFQVFINVVLLESMASGRMWPEAITAADEALRSIPGRSLHRPLLTWRAYCLGCSGRNVLMEMTRVKEYIPEYQGHTWAVLSHFSAARYDQLVALQKSYAAVGHQPWNKVRVSVCVCVCVTCAAVFCAYSACGLEHTCFKARDELKDRPSCCVCVMCVFLCV